jgi:uncharacterized membrane protein YhaH (DUF805 family)
MKLLTLLFSFGGRAGRKQFWLTQLGYAIFFAIVFSLTLFFAQFPNQTLIIFAAWIPGALAVYSVTIRRLHDRDRGAVWLFLFFILPAIMFVPSIFLETQLQTGKISQSFHDIAICILATVANIPIWWGYIEIGFLRGTRGPNRFGPDPLSPTPPPASLTT